MTRGRATLLLGTFLALCLAVRSLVRTPPPLGVSIAAFIGYAALVILGVLRPSLQMFAEVLWRGPEGARGVALTFDDGPHPESTLAVLDMLDRASAKATFFVIGEKATRWPDVIREIVKRGHLLGVHGNKHDRLLSLRSLSRVRADLASAVEELTKLTGERPGSIDRRWAKRIHASPGRRVNTGSPSWAGRYAAATGFAPIRRASLRAW